MGKAEHITIRLIRVKVSLLGGTLDIDYDRQNETMYMTGPAREVFEGWTDIY